MARKFLTALDLSKNELQNAVVQNLASAPGTPTKGQLYFDSTGNILYWYNGTGWIAAQGGAGAVPATTVTTQAVGDAAVVGVATTYAREDHKHGREAFGGVIAQTTFGLSSTNGSSANPARADHAHGTPAHDNPAHSGISLNAMTAPTSPLGMGAQRVTNMADPINATDGATKQYVDNLSAGLSWKDSVRAASTANRALSALTAMDGVTPVANDRILLKDQTAPAENGIWLAQVGAWTRALDADASAELVNATVFVEEGTLNADTAWTCSTNAPITVGTTSLTWVQFGTSTIAANSVDNTKLADMPMATIKGNDTGSTADPKDLTMTQLKLLFTGWFGRIMSAACAAALTTVVNHGLSTRDVLVEVYRNSTPWDRVDCDVERTDTNNVTVRFAVAPAAGDYRIVIIG